MRTKRLVAAAVAAGIAGMAFVAAASPASAWTRQDCERWDQTHETTHPDCIKYHTTTTVKGATTSTTVKTTTEVEAVEAVKAAPTFTG